MAVRTIAEVTVTDETDIDHLVTWYLRSTSPTKPSAPQDGSAPPSPWTSSEPGYDSSLGTTYLYTVTQTVWGDGSLTYGDVQLSSAYEAAKAAYNEASSVRTYATTEFQRTDAAIALRATKEEVDEVAGRIVGRNLFRGTKDAGDDNWKFYGHESVPESGVLRLTPTTAGAYAKYKVDYLDFAEYGSGTFTVSLDVRRLAGEYTDKRLRVILGFNRATRLNYVMSSTHDRFGSVYIAADEIGTDWTRVSATFDVPEDLNTGRVATLEAGSQLTFEPYLEASGNPVEIRHVKLERGDVATEWSEAPEDYTDEQVSIARAEIKVTTDGITSEVEKKTDKATIISTIRQSAETVKIKASQVEITGDVVFSAINDDTGTTKISGGKIDATSITIGQSQVTDLTTDLAAKATPADITTAIGAIEIGGRNLLRGTENQVTESYAKSRATVTDGILRLTPTTSYACAKWIVDYLDYSDFGSGTYTASCDVRLADVESEYTTVGFYIYFGFSIASRVTSVFSSSYDRYARKLAADQLTSDWTRVSITFDVSEMTTGQASALVAGSQLSIEPFVDGSNMPVDIRRLKLERGNKATDWTPAPEDVDASIMAVQDDLNATRTWYATCPTASGTAAKVATITPATTDFALAAGVTVAVKFDAANSVANPTLSVNGTDAYAIKRYGTTAPSTTAASSWQAGSVATLTYDGTYWQLNNWLNNNDNYYDREAYKAALAASAAISSGRIAVLGTDGKLKLLSASAFDTTGPIVYVGTAYSAADATAGTARTNNYTFWGTAFNLTNTHAVAGAAAGKPVYIVGTLSGKTFTPNSTVLTCTIPTSVDNLVYMRLGIMSTAANAVLESQHPLYMYFNGAFQQCDPATADAAKTATNYISIDPTNGIRIADADPDTATTYQHQTATETEFVVGGVSRAAISGDGARFGATDESHQLLDYHSMQLVDKNGDVYFHVSDLRGTDGYAIIVESFTVQSTRTFVLGLTASEITSVKVDGATVEYTSQTTSTVTRVTLATQPSSGAVVLIEYKTADYRAKAYTIGLRAAGSDIGAFSVAIGLDSTASGRYSHSEGWSTTASNDACHSEGMSTVASGLYSHAEGYASQATGGVLQVGTAFFTAPSHAEGYDTTASNGAAHAEGGSTVASGGASHAEGLETTASGDSSHAEGSFTNAVGNHSHAQNFYTTAAYDNQTAIGKYNDNQSTSAFEIGNGTRDSARSNAFAVDWSGNVVAAGGITLGTPIDSSQLDTVARDKGGTGVTGMQTGTMTLNTTNCTLNTDYNKAWHNGVVATVQLGMFKLNSALANGGTVAVGTVPDGYRPVGRIYANVACALAGVTGMLVAYIGSDGTISLVNRSGASLSASVGIIITATYAI